MEEDKEKLEEYLKRFEEAKKLEEAARKSLEEQAKIAEDVKKTAEEQVKMIAESKKAAEEAAKAAASIRPVRRDSQEFRFTDPEWEKFKILLHRIGKLEKQGKSTWKWNLLTGIITGLVVVVLGGIFTMTVLPRLDKWLQGLSIKPNTKRYLLVSLEDDPYSFLIAQKTKEIIDGIEGIPLKRFKFVTEDSLWYAKYYSGDGRVNRCIELSYNDTLNAWLIDGTPDSASIYHTLKKAMFAFDKDSGWVRPDSLPLNVPEIKVRFGDVRSRGQMPTEAGLRRYAITVVSPPTSWWEEE